MQALLDFFSTLGSIITGLVNFVISIIKDIVFVVEVTASVMLRIPQYFAWLPSALLSTLTVVFSVVVIYKIVGREG